MKRYFFVTAITKDKEHEYMQYSLWQRDIPRGKEINFNEVDKYCQEWFGYADYTITELYNCQECTKAEAEVLEKFINY